MRRLGDPAHPHRQPDRDRERPIARTPRPARSTSASRNRRGPAGRMARPRRFPACSSEAFRRRRDERRGPCTVLVCDNLPSNGETVARLSAAMRRSATPALALHRQRDRVPLHHGRPHRSRRPADADRAAIAALGYRDAWPVVAEPFSQWVIEDRFVPAARAGKTPGRRWSPTCGPSS